MMNWNPPLHLAKHPGEPKLMRLLAFSTRDLLPSGQCQTQHSAIPGFSSLAEAWTCAVSHLSRRVFAKAENITPMAMSFSRQVSVMVAPMDVSFPVFMEEAYHPAPLSEKTPPDTFVVEISALYKLPVNYSIASGDEKGEPLMWNNGKRGCETTSTAPGVGIVPSLSFCSHLSSTAIDTGCE